VVIALLALAAGVAIVSSAAGLWPRDGGIAASVPPIPADAQPVIVRDVLSGDTVVLAVDHPGTQVHKWGDITARLLSINSPNFSTPNECYAVEAEAALTALLPEGSVAWVATDETERDANGRWLMYVWTNDGMLVNAFLASSGFVRPEHMSPNNEHWALIAQGAEQAARRGVGLWGDCSLSP
jgi:endonuclease YncB( thermonuclease family)